jgi:hypothetical protein
MGGIPEKNTGKRSGLQIPREEAEKRIQAQIEKGFNLLERDINSVTDLEEAREEKRRWDKYNIELLKRIADTEEFLNEYYQPVGFRPAGSTSFGGQKKEHSSDVIDCINRLRAIKDRLVLIYELNHLTGRKIWEPEILSQDQNKIFIVHGHDEEAKQSVARFLERLDIEVVILHEQPNQGRTIIEKFEDYSDVSYAVVLLTPDDMGGCKNDLDDLLPRARQNVIFELGFFIGALGRERVCALYRGEVEIPSDFSGVLWILMDSEGAWQFKLAKEIKAAGFGIDLNRLV